jgi:hypothetical protein
MYSDPVPIIDANKLWEVSSEAAPIIPQNIFDFILI